MGRAFSRSSITAMSMGSETLSGRGASMGAPSETCSALAPTILALSKRVSFGGPIRLSLLKLIILVFFKIICFSPSYILKLYHKPREHDINISCFRGLQTAFRVEIGLKRE